MERVHPEVAQAAVLAVEARLPLPVDRLVRVEVARVEEERPHLEHAPVPPLGDEAPDLLAARVERELGRAAHEQVGVAADLGVDRVVRGAVDAERLLAEQVLPGAQDVAEDLLVEVVRDGDVHRVDVVEDLGVVRDQPRRRREPLVPREHVGIRVGDGGDDGARADRLEVRPPCGRAGELAAHQAAADDREAELARRLRHERRGERGPRPRSRRRARGPSAHA